MERQMTLEALGLGGGSVRIQVTSVDAGMSIDLDRESAVNHAASVLRHAGVTLIRIDRDGGYRVEAED